MNWRRRCGLLLGAAACVLAGQAGAKTGSSYRLVRTAPLGAPDRWDYVVADPGSHRVYVAHGDRVTVADGRTGAILGQVVGMPGGTHGTAIAAADGRGYTDDGEAGTVKSFDLKTLAVTKTLRAAPDADGMVRDPASGHIFVVDGDSGVLTVIDPKANAVIATVQVGGKLEAAVADGAGHLYVNGAGNKEIVRIDTRTNAVDARWPIADCTSPHGAAIDSTRHRLFSSCENSRLVVLDTDDGREVAAAAIGRGTDSAAYDPVRRRVFSSNGRDGTLSVIQQEGPDRYRVLDTVATVVSGRTMDVDPTTGRVYIAAADLADPSQPFGPDGRPRFKPGSLKLLMFDPVP